MPVPPPELTSFVADLQREAERALRRLCGAPDDYRVSFRGEKERVTVTLVSPGGVPMGLGIAWDRSGDWSVGGHAVTVYRHTDGHDVLKDDGHRSLLARLAERFDDDDTTELAEAMAHVQRVVRPLAQTGRLEDRTYRVLEMETGGLTGVLRLGFGCNQACGFCWQDRDWPSPPEELYTVWLGELAAQGCRQITITGGEPTLFRGLPDLIARATKQHGLAVCLQSNAIQMRRPAYAMALAEAGLGSVLVSLHSADPKVSDAMTRAPNTHEKTLQGIAELQRAGISVAINCVVDRDNYTGLEAHARLVVDTMVSSFPDNPVGVVNYSQPSEYHDTELFEKNSVPIDELGPRLVSAACVLRDAGVHVAAIDTCGFPACVFRDAPDAVDWHAREELDAAHLGARSLEARACIDCAARAHCPGVRPPYLRRYGERGLVPYAELPAAASRQSA